MSFHIGVMLFPVLAAELITDAEKYRKAVRIGAIATTVRSFGPQLEAPSEQYLTGPVPVLEREGGFKPYHQGRDI